jgi:tetratricopeptide (TPR) repeat protein
MKKWAVLLVCVVLLAIPAAALADVAPPAQPPGSNPEPGVEDTQVRMETESVLLDVLAGGENSLGQAQVTADFRMRNLGDELEQMAVRFPISANDGFYNYPEIENLQVKVNGTTVPTRRIQGEEPYFGGEQVPWAEFDVAFPPGEEVDIRVRYVLDGTGYYPFTSFNYILSSGAGWKDSIGEADVLVRLPYEASIANVLLSEDTGYWFTSPGAVLEGNEARWHFEDLEPTREDNLRVEMVAPSLWQKVIREQARIENDPQDGEAWGRLGKAYKESAFLPKEMRPDAGGQALFELSEQAYLKCLELKPNDADWHFGLAELYWFHYNTTQWNDPSNDANLKRAIDLTKKALEINPRNARAVELMDIFAANYPAYVEQTGDGYNYLYLTATPSPEPSETLVPTKPAPTAAPTGVPIGPSIQTAYAIAGAGSVGTSTAMVEPAVTLTQVASAQVVVEPTLPPTEAAPTPAVEEEDGGGSLSVCGVTLMIPLAGLVLFSRRREKR